MSFVDFLPHSVSEGRVALQLAGSAIAMRIHRRAPSTETAVVSRQPLIYKWAYDRTEGTSAQLYEQGAGRQWQASDLAWDTDVDPERLDTRVFPVVMTPGYGTRLWPKLDKRTRESMAFSTSCYLLSQFLHGEQAAMVLCGQTLGADLPLDERLFAAQQTADEARHVDVFSRYLTTKLQKSYAVDSNLKLCIHTLTQVCEWDLKVLGLQVLIEGLALGSFAFLLKVTREPLLRQLLTYVIRDETRHVRFGASVLARYYAEELNERERDERADWALMVTRLLHRRFMFVDLCDEFLVGVADRNAWLATMRDWHGNRAMHTKVFSRVMPNLAHIGLVTAKTRPEYVRMGVLAADSQPRAELLADEQHFDFPL